MTPIRQVEDLSPTCEGCPNLGVSCYGADREIKYPDCTRGRVKIASGAFRRMDKAFEEMLAAMEEMKKALVESGFPPEGFTGSEVETKDGCHAT